jgi:catechol 2,3-dioxygenase-like lactoylglutathione lyase family enzyme
MPPVNRVLETCIYVDDLERAKAFYSELFGFRIVQSDSRFCAFDVGGRSALLLFVRGATTRPVEVPGGVIPAHDGSGPLHFALAIEATELDPWKQHLAQEEVAIESEVGWPGGGQSIYFRDPDANLVELATLGLWGIN